MKTARLLLIALSLVGLGACQGDILTPTPDQDGYAGSGSQISPTGVAPSMTDGYAGSGS